MTALASMDSGLEMAHMMTNLNFSTAIIRHVMSANFESFIRRQLQLKCLVVHGGACTVQLLSRTIITACSYVVASTESAQSVHTWPTAVPIVCTLAQLEVYIGFKIGVNGIDSKGGGAT